MAPSRGGTAPADRRSSEPQARIPPRLRICHEYNIPNHEAWWWTNSLNSINEQLISSELRLQSELDSDELNPSAVLTNLSRALHSMVAHPHRYLSEHKSLQGTVMDMVTNYEAVHESREQKDHDPVDSDDLERATRSFSQVLSQIEATQDFAQELEKKIENILALLFNRIQINSDRLLVTTAARCRRS